MRDAARVGVPLPEGAVLTGALPAELLLLVAGGSVDVPPGEVADPAAEPSAGGAAAEGSFLTAGTGAALDTAGSVTPPPRLRFR
jgi:hypothetical protein